MSRRGRRCATAPHSSVSPAVRSRDVFKVNIYFADIGDWDSFNEIYRDFMPAPLPVRTAVQAVLLPGVLVEIEMWAVKADRRE